MRDLKTLQQKILSFRDTRGWTQFHDPKNLAEAISIGAGELLVNFLWKTVEQSIHLTEEERLNVKHEIADIFILLTYLCHDFNIDLLREVEIKIIHNEEKYPIEQAKANSTQHAES
jgi:NTP pyrophosphatase (non-canonical NTP hydrolase)